MTADERVKALTRLAGYYEAALREDTPLVWRVMATAYDLAGLQAEAEACRRYAFDAARAVRTQEETP